MSTGATPFSLVYGTEVVLPFEVEIPSLRVLMEAQLEKAEWVQVRHEQLNLIDERKTSSGLSWTIIPKKNEKGI